MSMPVGHHCETVQLRLLALIEAHPGIHADELVKLHYGPNVHCPFQLLRGHLRSMRGKGWVEARPLWEGGGWWAW